MIWPYDVGTATATITGHWVVYVPSGAIVGYTLSSVNSGAIAPELVLDHEKALLERKRRLSRAARVEATLVARRHWRRVVPRPRQGERFVGRTCSTASRWRVSQ